MTKIDEYHELLANEGYRPQRDESGASMTFKAEGTRYRLQLTEDDPDYIRLLSHWRLPEEATIETALRVAGEVNYDRKAVKVTVVPDDRSVLFSFEAFYKEVPHAAPFLGRAIDIIGYAATEFFGQIRERLPDSDAV